MSTVLSSVNTQSLTLVILATSTISLLTLVAIGVLYRHFHRIILQQQNVIHNLKEDVSALCSGAIGLGEHLTRLEEKNKVLLKRQDQLEMHEAPEYSYRQALKLAQKGADVDEVMADCGIARGEAELILLANRMGDTARKYKRN